MVWLCGGALCICTVMILGLLFLVLVLGIDTFWPGAVARVTLVDGTVHMGELARVEEYTLTPELVATLPEERVAPLRTRLGAEEELPAQRRLLRTGNFDLTGTHFHWVEDLLVTEEDRPPWALVVERTAWGRFYGEPVAFRLRHRREPGPAERELEALLAFHHSHPSEGGPAVTAALESQLAETRQTGTQLLLTRIPTRDDRQQEVVLDDGGTRPRSELDPGQNVVELVEVWNGPAAAWTQYLEHHGTVRRRWQRQREVEKEDIGAVNARAEQARLAVREIEPEVDAPLLPIARNLADLDRRQQQLEAELAGLEGLEASARRWLAEEPSVVQLTLEQSGGRRAALREELAALQEARTRLQAQAGEAGERAGRVVADYVAVLLETDAESRQLTAEIAAIKAENLRYELRMQSAQGVDKTLELAEIVRAYPANQLSWWQKLATYCSRWWEFLSSEPREANSEGGVWPAIFGTVAMTIIMAVAVVPFGVLAALYLREYARAGVVVSTIRIAINNLAGVPSIVYGVFGLGFFHYLVGAYIDGGPANAGITPWPPATWFLALAVLALCGTTAFIVGLVGMARAGTVVTVRKRLLRRLSVVLWVTCFVLLCLLIARTPFFDGLYGASLPNPTFGKGALLWGSLTLALLTLPVVIVATEEALAAVPGSMREGSYACGASQWQTVQRIVLPRALPGIMTGMILAMARGAGEVAPLMLVGAVKLAPELPFDWSPPFGVNRSFMHLGFHIYDLGFQSQNSEAAKPMVFTTTLLLILIIAILNLFAIWLRGRLRRRFVASQF